jgi:D-beta-D-heptose 7-phosphate kinase / D-beta-D-heptose 1-phosphate adenosyltransferase
MMQRLLDILAGFGSPRIALVGDFMLDRWVYGSAERLSPEAPVPVLRKVRQKTLTGGAGNTAEAIVALGAQVVCIGVAGADANGDEMVRLLAEAGAGAANLIRQNNRATTVKTRYVGLAQHRHAQQMFRVDEEASDPLSEDVTSVLRSAVRAEIQTCAVLALEDYNKGVLSAERTPEIIADARKAGRPVVVDPALVDDYRRYRGATLLTPNRYEAQLASGIAITDDASLEQAARRIQLIAEVDAVLVTLDKEGAYLLSEKSPGRRIPTRPREVYDVSGAGDEVLAMMAVAISEGCDYDQAAALANVAGGLEVGQFGVVAIQRQEVLDELRRMLGLRGSKRCDRTGLARDLERRRESGQKIVFTNGCFDLLHMGHLRYLREARELGACLVVAINSDRSVQALKGPKRPIIGEDERAEMLGALECVDYVTIFDEETPEALLELLRPDVLVKGGTTPMVVGREIVEGYGGSVRTLSLVDGLSTTKIIERVLAAHDDNQ